MSDLLIKPLRAYEDRGIIRDADNEPYAAPVWLAKELQQLKLCEIVGEVGGEKGGAAADGQAAVFKLQKKGQKWIIVDAEAAQVGEFIGRREEAEIELAKLLAANPPATAVSSTADSPPTAVEPPAYQPPVAEPPVTPPQE
jgi:hypothetical protein